MVFHDRRNLSHEALQFDLVQFLSLSKHLLLFLSKDIICKKKMKCQVLFHFLHWRCLKFSWNFLRVYEWFSWQLKNFLI
jgi:hypothetical protein